MATTDPVGDLHYSRRRRALPAAGALVLVAALAACTGQGSAGKSSSATSGAARAFSWLMGLRIATVECRRTGL